METVDMTEAHQKPFTIRNQLLILGNPVIRAETLQQLTTALDEAGLDKPIVILNPEANSVPGFADMLSNLIQSNRSFPMINVTTADKYNLRDCSDAELNFKVQQEVQANPRIVPESLLNIYQGLRARSQALFSLESLSRERDWIWSQHLANPQIDVGFARYQELNTNLIPQANAYYSWVCDRLSHLQVEYRDAPITEQPVEECVPPIPDIEETVEKETSESSEIAKPTEESPTVTAEPSRMKLWGPWNNILNMQMPLSVAKSLVSSRYPGLESQQHDVVVGGVSYKAVEPEVLIALGVPLYQDGVPVVYTEIGTFKRVGDSEHLIGDLSYWYPKPIVKELM